MTKRGSNLATRFASWRARLALPPSCTFRPIYKWFVMLFIADCVLLGYIGGKPAEEPYILIGQFATAWYFIHLLIVTPLVGWLEKPRPLPESISAAVTKKEAV